MGEEVSSLEYSTHAVTCGSFQFIWVVPNVFWDMVSDSLNSHDWSGRHYVLRDNSQSC